MGPDQVKLISALVVLFKEFSGWPCLLSLGLLVIGPWVLSIVLSYTQDRRAERRFEAVARMYENNVELLRTTQALGADYKEMARGLTDIITLNTETMTRLVDAVKTNQYCPAVRLREETTGPSKKL